MHVHIRQAATSGKQSTDLSFHENLSHPGHLQYKKGKDSVRLLHCEIFSSDKDSLLSDKSTKEQAKEG